MSQDQAQGAHGPAVRRPSSPKQNPRRERYPDMSPATKETYIVAAPGRCRLMLRLDGRDYAVRPVDAGDACPGAARAYHVRSLAEAPEAEAPVLVAELAQGEPGGCNRDGYRGTACSCRAADTGIACRHIRALVACGLLRPHAETSTAHWPAWTDETWGLVPEPATAAGAAGA